MTAKAWPVPLGPTKLRLLSALVAGALAVSGCVTTYAVAPARLIEVAGLPQDQEAEVQTMEGLETVKGWTRVTLRSTEGGVKTTNEVRLSSLRSEAGALVLPGNAQTLALNNIWSAEFTKPSASKTAGLAAVIVVGIVLLALVVAAGSLKY